MDEREAALAESPAINGTLHTNSVTSTQLRKLQELRHKRLQLKKAGVPFAASANPKKQNKRMANLKDNLVDWVGSDLPLAENPQGTVERQELRATEIIAPAQKQSKKRQKLSWGLDTKERWERKGNM